MTHGVFGLLRQPDGLLKADAQCWLSKVPQGVPGEQLLVYAEVNKNWVDRRLPVEALASYRAQRFGAKLRHSRLELEKEDAQELAERLNALVPPHRLEAGSSRGNTPGLRS
ncbi:MAG: hypothetical protein V4451_17330 [Pseudomonadota bacterium]